ncbi:MAG: SPOR domain-containing protein [Gallionella sp.]|jgi:TPR repeat protein
MIRTLLTSLILLTLLSPAIARAGVEGELSSPHNNIQSLGELRARAAAGDADAQFYLGGVFFKGQEVKQDYAEAVKWLRLAAVQGHPQAQFNLGMMYDAGQGLVQNHAEAARLYRTAADQGLALAQLNLGVAYANGEGVPQNDTEAVKWFRRASEQGEAQAQFDLGVMYAKGQGVGQNMTEAYRLARLAAAQGHEMAKALMMDLTKKMTPEQQANINRPAAQAKTPPAALVTGNKPATDTSLRSDDYYVQLGAFKTQNMAADFMEKIRAKLGDIDKPYSLFTNEGWVRIHVGPYTSQDEARRSADNFKVKLGYEPKVRRH